jgi:glycosyltransferase involved in cell wall biosynthesis
VSASSTRGTVAFVNNSRETFTPTVSGAIATCVHEVGRVALAEGFDCPVITRPADAAPHDWPDLRVLRPIRQHRRASAKAQRARRRLNGWARPDQWVFAREALAELEQLRPRAVVVNNDPEVAVFLSRKLPGMRVVHWFHNLEMSSDRFRRRFAADRGIRSVAVSGYLARAVEQVYQLTPLTVTAALNGVAADRFGTERTSPLVTVGYLGRLAVEKAPDTLVAACIRVAERGARFRLQLVGDTNFGFSSRNPFVDRVDSLVAELEGLGIEVVRTGHLERPGIPGALAASDIHVTPSRWDEPCGLTTLEGLASGQAVVGSATGGPPELLDGAGLLFPRDDIDALADVLEGLIRDANARAAWGARARSRAESLTWERTWDGLAHAAGRRVVGGD